MTLARLWARDAEIPGGRKLAIQCGLATGRQDKSKATVLLRKKRLFSRKKKMISRTGLKQLQPAVTPNCGLLSLALCLAYSL